MAIVDETCERIKDSLPPDWGDGYPNVWLGVTVDNQKSGLPRMSILKSLPAKIRFLSIEPLLEDLGPVDLSGIGWVIVGGESGPGARPMRYTWAENASQQALSQKVPLFFKQWGVWRNNPLVLQHDLSVGKMPTETWLNTVDPVGKGGSKVFGQYYKQFPKGWNLASEPLAQEGGVPHLRTASLF